MQSPALTREQSRRIDRLAMEEHGIAGAVLMENAGRGVAETLHRLGIHGPVGLLCGVGNNAGDGFVVARLLSMQGEVCRVALLHDQGNLKGDALANYEKLRDTKVEIAELGSSANYVAAEDAAAEGFVARLDDFLRGSDWIVDAMLGTGAKGDPRPPLDVAIGWMNAQHAKKLAVDVPSGLDCDTGLPARHAVKADHTCTFVAGKIGFAAEAAHEYTGTVHIVDIGIPEEVLRQVREDA